MTRQPVPTTTSAGPNLALIEKGIAPTAGRAANAQLFNADGTPTRLGRQLPDLVPEIVGERPGPKFDAGLVKGLRRMEDGIEAADALVPEGTTISSAPIKEGFQALIDEAVTYGNKRLANALQQKLDSWSELGDSIPWPTFRDAKRKFFKERNADINSATMRRAYGVLMEASESIGGDIGQTLAAANARYSTVRRVIDAAGIDPVTGRRPAKSVGKVDQVKAIQQSVPNLMTALESLEGGSPGMPITTRALRDALGPSYEAAIKAAVKEGKVVVHRVDAGGGRTPAQRAADGLIELDGNWYVAVSRRQQ